MMRYPNLELIEYKIRLILSKDPEFQAALEAKRKERKYAYLEFQAMVFPQVWGSTCTGFDVTEDGMPTIGGCMMTTEYTTVFQELLTNTYVVCFGDRPCYSTKDPNEAFLADLSKMNMASLSEAKKKY